MTRAGIESAVGKDRIERWSRHLPPSDVSPGDEAGPLRWYEWADDRWQIHELLDIELDHGHSIDTGDINRDGHLDLFVAEMGT